MCEEKEKEMLAKKCPLFYRKIIYLNRLYAFVSKKVVSFKYLQDVPIFSAKKGYL